MEILSNWYASYLNQEFAYRFVGGIIFFIVLLSLVLLIGILISRTINNRRDRTREYWHKQFQDLLVRLLFEPEYQRGEPAYKKFIKKYHADNLPPLGREVLVNDLSETHKGVRGETGEQIESLFVDLGLDKYSVQMIKKGPWYKTAKGLREIAEFNVKAHIKLALKLVDHPNKILRSEAQYAAISLGGIDVLHFVEKLRTELTEWQQLLILERLLRFQLEAIPDVSHWLSLKNDSVVIFATKLMVQFNQFRASGELIKLMDHPNDLVKIAAIDALRRLNIREAAQPIMEHYYQVKPEVQRTMLISLGDIGNRGTIDLLKKEFSERKEFDLVMQAGKALHKLGATFEMKALTRNITDQEDMRLRIMQHVTDDRI
ncbi:MAG: HEAT repeat domain-containing protein [Flavobacteriales bacterium]|nr:HEAT repeat domain-containing protein [Flavobacteriales bacterium]